MKRQTLLIAAAVGCAAIIAASQISNAANSPKKDEPVAAAATSPAPDETAAPAQGPGCGGPCKGGPMGKDGFRGPRGHAGGPQGFHRGGDKAGGQRPGGPHEIFGQLNLTPEQKAKVKEVREANKPKIDAIRKEEQAKIQAVMDEAKEQIKPILTPAQQQVLADMQQLRNSMKKLREDAAALNDKKSE